MDLHGFFIFIPAVMLNSLICVRTELAPVLQHRLIEELEEEHNILALLQTSGIDLIGTVLLEIDKQEPLRQYGRSHAPIIDRCTLVQLDFASKWV